MPTSHLHRQPLLIDLALQGGGSHGAFTWGVLDRLLEESWLAYRRHLRHLGRRHERRRAGATALQRAERRARGRLSMPLGARGSKRRPSARCSARRSIAWLGRWTLDYSPVFIGFDLMARLFSPYDLNPAGINPLTRILDDSIDFERLARSPIKLFVTATNVRTGRGRVFRNDEITAAGAARLGLPAHAVPGGRDRRRSLIGTAASPAIPTITPLVRECDSQDTILVQINPGGAPRHAAHCARDPQPAERGVVQRGADEGAAHDRAAAPGRAIGATARARGGPPCAPTGS